MTGCKIRVGILGTLQVETEDGLLQITATKQRVVLVVLALNHGRSVGAEQLIDNLWGDDPPRSATKTLQTYISGLRRILPAETLRTVPGGYELDLAPEEFDADVFEGCLKSARLARETGKGAEAKEFLVEALTLWRGPALGDLAGEVHGLTAAQRLDELRRVALEDLHGVRMEAGGDGGLVADLEAAVSEEPLRERRWAQLMTALYRSGRQGDALRVYRRLQEYLSSELGIEPSAELVQLEQAILMQDPALNLVGPNAEHAGGRGSISPTGATVPTLKQTDPVEARFSLQDRQLTIGRQVGHDVVLDSDLRVSRHHAEIQERDGEWVLRDLRSRNGTILNGERITESLLRSGDEIKIGGAVFQFVLSQDPMATATGTWARNS